MFLRRSSKWVAMGVLALVYFFAGKAGLSLAFVQPSASPVWPPAGLAVAALLVLGIPAWPAIFVGAFFVNLTTTGNIATSLCIASGNSLEAIYGVWLLNRFAGGSRAFERAQDVFKFVFIAAVTTAISPSIGLTSLVLGGFAEWVNYWGIWFTWWLGDFTGFLLVAPLVLLWWTGSRPVWSGKQKAEAAIIFVLLVGLGGTVFGGWFAEFIKNYPVAFVSGPVVLWTAFRFGPRETATAVCLLAGIALWGTLHHYGPYQLNTPTQSLLTLQCWAGVMTLTSMTLAAAMTERRRIEAELEQQKAEVESANQTKDNFLAMLSHELRTPLTPVVSFLDILESESERSEEGRNALATIRRNIDLERRLIDDLLDLTRIAKGKLVLEIKVLDAHEAITQAVEMCRQDAAAKQLRINLQLRATNFYIAADSAKFQQIIWNLLKNAIKFSPEKREVTVSSENTGPSSLTITVRDQGIGIEPEAIGRVFDPFEQGDRSFRQRQGGLGLGLAISQAIAIGHGGLLAASSDGRDRGATFCLTMKTVEPVAISEKGNALPSDVARRPLRILLVDDHEDTCVALSKLLGRRGHRIVTAHNVESALEAARSEPFDLLISDAGLPDGTGAELMMRLREVQTVPGVAISGFGMNGDVQKSLAAGYSTHLIKPVTFEQLEEAMARTLDQEGGEQTAREDSQSTAES
jgi:signal transduction histidine kinase/ActR/RegA family two-component response regulator